ncbi:hypothetical protein PoB_000435100 [Plakobranchus ocellatus]|uniref:Uncharacterized protein n=1 Tax=Plakobranchus ocellatus TaxID=259542 RepID=A0AAV3Y5Z5_9GAST|nr:hypothetical protein PoB_000435100 [Plakobranchus ocellatus]
MEKVIMISSHNQKIKSCSKQFLAYSNKRKDCLRFNAEKKKKPSKKRKEKEEEEEQKKEESGDSGLGGGNGRSRKRAEED